MRKDSDGKKGFQKGKELIKIMTRGLIRYIKQRVVNSLTWGVTLYGAETWTMRKKDVKWIEDFQMCIYSRMEMICWIEDDTNEKVVRTLEEKRS